MRNPLDAKLAQLTRETREFFNQTKRAGKWEEYKTSRWKYNYTIRKTNEKSHFEKVQKIPEDARL